MSINSLTNYQPYGDYQSGGGDHGGNQLLAQLSAMVNEVRNKNEVALSTAQLPNEIPAQVNRNGLVGLNVSVFVC